MTRTKSQSIVVAGQVWTVKIVEQPIAYKRKTYGMFVSHPKHELRIYRYTKLEQIIKCVSDLWSRELRSARYDREALPEDQNLDFAADFEAAMRKISRQE